MQQLYKQAFTVKTTFQLCRLVLDQLEQVEFADIVEVLFCLEFSACQRNFFISGCQGGCQFVCLCLQVPECRLGIKQLLGGVCANLLPAGNLALQGATSGAIAEWITVFQSDGLIILFEVPGVCISERIICTVPAIGQ